MSVSRKEHPWMLLLLLPMGCTLSPPDSKPGDTGAPTATSSPGDSAPPGDTAPGDSGTEPTDSGPRDADGDGSPDGDDCDDADPEVYPGAPERCNGLDDDCDGAVEPNCMTTDEMDYRIVSSLGPSFGVAMHSPGDVDGDGLDDLLIHDNWLTSDLEQHSAAYSALILGSSLTSRDLDAADIAAAFFQGNDEQWLSPSTMIGLGGDVDGDGLFDVAMGGTSPTEGSGVGIFTGATMSAGGAWLHPEDADLWIAGPTMNSVASAHDIDGDGIVDIVAEEPGDYDEDVAWVRGLSGASIGGGADFSVPMFELETEKNTPSAGGDVDGDGLTDLVLSDDMGCGGLDEACWRLFLGATLGAGGDFVATDADAWWWSESIRVHASADPEIYPDLSGDGLAEVVVYADGTTYLGLPISAGDSGTVQAGWVSISDGVRFRHLPIPAVGDLNGDGRGDLQLYVSEEGVRSGVSVFASLPAGGALDVDAPDFSVLGDGADNWFANGELHGTVDIDADGLSDIFAGALQGAHGEGAALLTRSSGLHW